MCNGTEYQPFDCEADDASPDCQVDAGLAAVTCERGRCWSIGLSDYEAKVCSLSQSYPQCSIFTLC